MSRDLEAALEGALGDAVLEPFFAIELLFDSGALRFWTGYGTKTIGGEEYIGTGSLLGISDIGETAEIAAAGVTLTLSGVPSELLSLALSEPYQNRIARVHFGLIGSEDDMAEVFTGTMDQLNIEEGPETSVVQVAIENRLLDLERPRVRRYTNNDQQSRFPGDKGFEFVETVQDREIFWGRQPG
jgi:hypothetical protein